MRVSDTRPLPGYPVGAALPGQRGSRHYGWDIRDTSEAYLARRQRAAYVELMGHEPPESDNYEKKRQFLYNPRGRGAKEILAACATA